MKFLVVVFYLQFTCVFVHGSFMFESLLLCISMVPNFAFCFLRC